MMFGPFGYGPYGPGGGWGWGSMFGGSAVTLVFWGLIIVGIVVLVRYVGKGTAQQTDRSTAMEILRRRYASGDLTKQQFEDMRRDIA